MEQELNDISYLKMEKVKIPTKMREKRCRNMHWVCLTDQLPQTRKYPRLYSACVSSAVMFHMININGQSCTTKHEAGVRSEIQTTVPYTRNSKLQQDGYTRCLKPRWSGTGEVQRTEEG